ncbi:MAG: HAD-IA family hydrolase [Symploca sp. SIO2B6]|nr:HAD-IA family hydrolase [Symploca sp. SIO2B6]
MSEHFWKPVSVVIFDFDGTIADTLEPLLAIANQLADEFGYPPITLEYLKQLQLLDTRDIIRQSKIPILKIPFLLRRLRSELNQRISTVQPIQGVPEALAQLKQQGHTIGIVTSNSEENVLAFLRHQGLLNLFDFVKSGTTIFGKHRVINRLLKKQNIDVNQAIYVGDETRDIESAKAINMRIISVSWGFHDYSVLARYKPTQLIESPHLLIDSVQKLSCQFGMPE